MARSVVREHDYQQCIGPDVGNDHDRRSIADGLLSYCIYLCVHWLKMRWGLLTGAELALLTRVHCPDWRDPGGA